LLQIFLFSVAAAMTVLAWNEKNQKLTSGDANGLIIVWVLVRGNLGVMSLISTTYLLTLFGVKVL